MESQSNLINQILDYDLNENKQNGCLDLVFKLCYEIEPLFNNLYTNNIPSKQFIFSDHLTCEYTPNIIQKITKVFHNRNISLKLFKKIISLLNNIYTQKNIDTFIQEYFIKRNNTFVSSTKEYYFIYDDSFYKSIEEELDNLGEFSKVINAYHDNYMKIKEFIFPIDLNKFKTSVQNDLLLYHAHVNIDLGDGDENIFLPDIQMYIKIKDGNKKIFLNSINDNDNDLNEKNFEIATNFLLTNKIYFGIGYKIKEDDDNETQISSPLTNSTPNSNNNSNSNNTILFCKHASSFHNLLHNNLTDIYYITNILTNKTLWELQPLVPFFYIISVINLYNTYNDNNEYIRGNNDIIYKDNLLNDWITNELESKMFSVNSLFALFQNISHSPFNMLLSLNTRALIFKFTFDNRKNYTNQSIYIYNLHKKNKPNAYVNMMLGSSANKNRYKITITRGNEDAELNILYLTAISNQDKQISQSSSINNNNEINIISYPGYLEFDFLGEVGKGTGPTLEFYTNVFNKFKLKSHLWLESNSNNNNTYYPLPINNITAVTLNEYELLGFLIARSIFDDIVIDFPLSHVFINLLFDNIPSYHSIKYIHPELYNVITELKGINNDNKLFKGTPLNEMCIYFILPGYDYIELTNKGNEIQLNETNVNEYIDLVMDVLFKGNSIMKIKEAFLKGFEKVFTFNKLKMFSAFELENFVFSNLYEHWNEEDLNDNLIPDHGYTKESKVFKWLIQYLIGLDKESQRKFLKFATGSVRLPIGGFKMLNPKLTIVKRELLSTYGMNSKYNEISQNYYLPSVMTCQNYLKIPEYTSYEMLTEKMNLAINEGGSEFHFS